MGARAGWAPPRRASGPQHYVERDRALCGEDWRATAQTPAALAEDPSGRVCRRCWAFLLRRYARMASQGKLTRLIMSGLGQNGALVLPEGELQRLLARRAESRAVPEPHSDDGVVDIRGGWEIDMREGPDPLEYLDQMAAQAHGSEMG